MHWLRSLIAALVLANFIGSVQPAHACPLCKEAIASPGDGDDEIITAPAAYNQSIYLMAGMPYVLLSVFGFMIYRGCKKNEQYLRANGEQGDGPAGI